MTWWRKKYYLVLMGLVLVIGGWWVGKNLILTKLKFGSNNLVDNFQAVTGRVVWMEGDDVIMDDNGTRYKMAGMEKAEVMILESNGDLIQGDLEILKNLIFKPHIIEADYSILENKPVVDLIKVKLHSGLDVKIESINLDKKEMVLEWVGKKYNLAWSEGVGVIDEDMKEVDVEEWSKINNRAATIWWGWDWGKKEIVLKQIMLKK